LAAFRFISERFTVHYFGFIHAYWQHTSTKSGSHSDNPWYTLYRQAFKFFHRRLYVCTCKCAQEPTYMYMYWRTRDLQLFTAVKSPQLDTTVTSMNSVTNATFMFGSGGVSLSVHPFIYSNIYSKIYTTQSIQSIRST